jgi:glycosyltransferase involved in cell wall biosynthesis
MRVVIVDGDVSYPPTSGKRLRTLNLMLRLASRHRITYIARSSANTEENRTAAEFLADAGIEPVLVDDPIPTKSGAVFYARLAANVLSPLPYSVVTHDTPRMRNAVRSFAAENDVDLWQFEWTPYLAALSEHPKAKKVLVAHNVDSLIWQRTFETVKHPLKHWFIKQQWRKFKRFERRAFAEATRIVAVSSDDAALLHDEFHCPRVDVVENGIDRTMFEPVVPRHDPRRILFLGALDWRPNLDAIRLLLDRVFPAVRIQEPRALLDIVGRNPSAWLAARVAQHPGVALHADVPDVRPFLAGSGMMTVPLRIGGGSRLKILEALACGLPVVSTRVGAEGLRLDDGRHLTIVPDVDGMAQALVETIRQPGRAAAQATEGRKHVLAEYDWDELANKLEIVWEKSMRQMAQFVTSHSSGVTEPEA